MIMTFMLYVAQLPFHHALHRNWERSSLNYIALQSAKKHGTTWYAMSCLRCISGRNECFGITAGMGVMADQSEHAARKRAAALN